jgi:hypothetical protein
MPLPPPAAGLGLEVNTGRAVVVILVGTFQTPEIVLRNEIDLAEPEDGWRSSYVPPAAATHPIPATLH